VCTLLLYVAVDTATSAFDVAVALCIYIILHVVLVSYQLSYFVMEPTFSSTTLVTTVTLVLAAQIQATTAALPEAHRVAPQEQEIVESKDAALLRLQN
jgi:hypothetical protein